MNINTHNSATSTAWSFDHPAEDTITPEQFVSLAYEGLKVHMRDLAEQVREYGILSISDSVIDLFDTMDETLHDKIGAHV